MKPITIPRDATIAVAADRWPEQDAAVRVVTTHPSITRPWALRHQARDAGAGR
jgi:hypothetical protein